MKSFSFITAFFVVCIITISQVWATPVEPMEHTENVMPPVRVEEPQSCAATMDVEHAHRNLIMAVCNQMQPGFMNRMMETGGTMHMDRRSTEEANPAQFPPFPPFPPPPTFPPFPPFPPSTPGGGFPFPPSFPPSFPPVTFPPFPPFPPPPTFPPFPPFPPGGRRQ